MTTTAAMAEGLCLSLTSHLSTVRILPPHHHSPLLHFPSSSRPLRSLHHSLRKNSSFHLPLVARAVDSGIDTNVAVQEVETLEVLEAEEEGEVEVKVEFEVGTEAEEEDYVEPPEEAKIFVGNLPFDLDSENLAKLFDQAGVVEIAEVKYNRETDQSRGFGFVTMSTVDEAEKAVDMLNRYDLGGRQLTVNKAAPRGTRPAESPQRELEPSLRIYIGNLPWQVDGARLEQLFSEHGKVVDARVVNDRESGRSRGFGFVTMSTRSEVDDAIAALNGQSLDGRAVRVNVAEERPRRGGF